MFALGSTWSREQEASNAAQGYVGKTTGQPAATHQDMLVDFGGAGQESVSTHVGGRMDESSAERIELQRSLCHAKLVCRKLARMVSNDRAACGCFDTPLNPAQLKCSRIHMICLCMYVCVGVMYVCMYVMYVCMECMYVCM